MEKNQVAWETLKEHYTKAELPEGYNFYTLLDGENGPMVGNLYEDRQQPDKFVIKVSTPAGLIDAILLGCKKVALVIWPVSNPEVETGNYQGISAKILAAHDIGSMSDGDLILLKREYEEHGLSVRSKQNAANPGQEPITVWDYCADVVQHEIERRIAPSVQEVIDA